MNAQSQQLIIRRPDDWHTHLRDDEMLRVVLPYTSAVYARAIIMPNLVPPVTTVKAAIAYRERILAALPKGHVLQPLMTCYLTDSLNADELEKGFSTGIFTAAKLYPANATTNSSYGITCIDSISSVLERIQYIGMPLLVHSEITSDNIDIFDREVRFIETVMKPLRQRYPKLKIVFEHVTTKEAVQYVERSDELLGATITPQHLMFNRNHMLASGIRPHLYCMPVLKRNIHQEALRKVIASGNMRFFLGTDTAPHLRQRKETSCGCAGIFNAPTALVAYLSVFEEMNALQYFEAFCSENGSRFYGLPLNEGTIRLVREPWTVDESITVMGDKLVPFLAGETLNWRVA